MICRAEGLVLRSYRMSGSSKVVVVFTKEGGKLKFAAKGARRPKSKFGASLEPITWGVYDYFRREGRELQSLVEADILNPFAGIKVEYRRLVYASVICDLLNGATTDEDRNPALLNSAVVCLLWLETVLLSAVELPLWAFQLKAVALLGYRIHLIDCVKCGGVLPGNLVCFSPEQGGTVCAKCATGELELKRSTIDFLQNLEQCRPEEIDTSKFNAVEHPKVRRALRTFLTYYVEGGYRAKSFEFLDRMLVAESMESPYRTGKTQEGVS